MSALHPPTAPRAPALGAKPAGTLAGRTPMEEGEDARKGFLHIMKNSKKLTILGLSAATALVAATGAVSSFAWFAANGSVTANDMTVKALSTTAYLQIKNSTDEWTTDNHTAASAVIKEATLNPTHIFKTLTINTDKEDVTEDYDGGSTVKWASANSKNVGSSAKDGHYTDVSSTADPAAANIATTYTLKNTFNLRLRPNKAGAAQATAGALTASVAFVNDSPDEIRKAVSVFVTIGENGMLFTNGGTTFTAQGNDNLMATMTATAVDAKVFVFFDGENSACFTNNVNVDSTYSVKVTFSLVA